MEVSTGRRRPRGDRLPPEDLGPFNDLREFVQMTDFLAAWQMLDPGSDDYGGMIEAESGDLGGVIQTDNTLEAIWCWSRYRELTGLDTYDENIAAAWVYCERYPAWDEEGGAGDDSFARYAVSCAQYIVDHPLDLSDGDVWSQRLGRHPAHRDHAARRLPSPFMSTGPPPWATNRSACSAPWSPAIRSTRRRDSG